MMPSIASCQMQYVFTLCFSTSVAFAWLHTVSAIAVSSTLTCDAGTTFYILVQQLSVCVSWANWMGCAWRLAT